MKSLKAWWLRQVNTPFFVVIFFIVFIPTLIYLVIALQYTEALFGWPLPEETNSVRYRLFNLTELPNTAHVYLPGQILIGLIFIVYEVVSYNRTQRNLGNKLLLLFWTLLSGAYMYSAVHSVSKMSKHYIVFKKTNQKFEGIISSLQAFYPELTPDSSFVNNTCCSIPFVILEKRESTYHIPFRFISNKWLVIDSVEQVRTIIIFEREAVVTRRYNFAKDYQWLAKVWALQPKTLQLLAFQKFEGTIVPDRSGTVYHNTSPPDAYGSDLWQEIENYVQKIATTPHE